MVSPEHVSAQCEKTPAAPSWLPPDAVVWLGAVTVIAEAIEEALDAPAETD